MALKDLKAELTKDENTGMTSKGGREKVYIDGKRKMLTINMYEKDIERLKEATKEEYGRASGHLTEMINKIVLAYLDKKGF